MTHTEERKTGWTRGPWEVRVGTLVLEVFAGKQQIAAVNPNHQSEANANLIAAAPQGYDFAEHALPNLRWALVHLPGNGSAWRELIAECEAYMAAARGEAS